MSLLEPAAARPLFKQLLMLFVLLSVFTLAAALLARSFRHYDVAVASLDESAKSGMLLQQLDRLDVQYHVRKDGRVLVPSTEMDRLQRADVQMDDVRSAPPRVYQLLLILLLAGVALALFFAGRKSITVIRELFAPGAEVAGDEISKGISENSVPLQAMPSQAQHGKHRPFVGEHPQTVAVYLLGMAAAEAAEALETMSDAQREAVWERMAFSGACEKSLQAYVHRLYVRKAEAMRKRTRPPEVTEKMAAIFRRLPILTQEMLLGALRRGDADDAFVALLEAETKKQVSTKEA